MNEGKGYEDAWSRFWMRVWLTPWPGLAGWFVVFVGAMGWWNYARKVDYIEVICAHVQSTYQMRQADYPGPTQPMSDEAMIAGEIERLDAMEKDDLLDDLRKAADRCDRALAPSEFAERVLEP